MGESVKDISSKLGETGILPVVCLQTENELKTFAEALLTTPVRCIEITMRHPFSYEAIQYFKKTHPEFTVGAGTVVSTNILNAVSELGVDFCVSPGFDQEIVTAATGKNMPFIPGCATPSELLMAQKHGIHLVKLFPAECSGGVQALKLYKSAFSDLSFLPTGGITAKNYIEYLKCGNVTACGGSFMIPKDMLLSGDATGISNIIHDCIAAIREVKRQWL